MSDFECPYRQDVFISHLIEHFFHSQVMDWKEGIARRNHRISNPVGKRDQKAKRYEERKGGYTRVLNTVNRASDNSKMAIIELVDKKEKIIIQEDRKTRRLAALPKKKREKIKAAMVTAVEKTKDKKKDKKAKKKKEKKKDK